MNRFGSPGTLAHAELVTDGSAAAPITTLIVNHELSPDAITSGLVALTTDPRLKKIQPVPEDEAKLRPAGSVSRTVTAPVVGPVPTFRTTSR